MKHLILFMFFYLTFLFVGLGAGYFLGVYSQYEAVTVCDTSLVVQGVDNDCVASSAGEISLHNSSAAGFRYTMMLAVFLLFLFMYATYVMLHRAAINGGRD